jgi:hypothetical protein
MIEQAYRLPELGELRTYLQLNGWVEGYPGPSGSLWSKQGYKIGVPLIDDEAVKRGALERLARINEVAVSQLIDQVRYFSIDVTNFRARNDSIALASIPLETAIIITRSARAMLRSCGTTAFRIQGDLKGHYSKSGDEVVRSARMGHTKDGSFIIPILVALSPVESPELQADALIEIEQSAPEPYERRIVRTLAQSLQAVDEIIVRPGTEPTLSRLYAAVELGVSRELCVALGHVLAEPAVAEFRADFNWAPAFSAPPNTASEVSVSAEAQDLVIAAAKRLKEVRVEPTRVMSGDIIELRHKPRDPFGLITISTARNGRPAEVRITLPLERYLDALEWHRENRTILVEGEVRGGRGERLHVDAPARCHPIDDLFSTGSG